MVADNMIVTRYTCRPSHDPSLAGIPASIYACDEEADEYILQFDDDSRLRIPIKELVRMKWDLRDSQK